MGRVHSGVGVADVSDFMGWYWVHPCVGVVSVSGFIDG